MVTVAIPVNQVRCAEQIGERVGEALDLIELDAGDRPTGADDRVAGAHQHGGIMVDRPRAVPELAGEAVVHASKLRGLGLAQVEIAEETPDPDRQVADERLLDPAEPAHEAGQEAARNPVGQ
jgi:hypothetical protein